MAEDAAPPNVTSTEFVRVVHLPAKAAFDEFREHGWKKTMGPQGWTYIAEVGDPETHIGETRVVPGGLHERILAFEDGKFFEYSVVAGPFPVDYHRGRVEFTEFVADSGERMTRITWTIKYKAKTGMGPVVAAVVQSTIPIFIGNVESACAKRAQAEKKA